MLYLLNALIYSSLLKHINIYKDNEKILELLRRIDFPDFTTYTCLNRAYKYFSLQLTEVIDSLGLLKN